MLETKGDRLSRYAEQVAALSLSEAKHGAGDAAAMIRTLDSLHLAGIDPQPKAWAIPNFAPAAEVTLFTGAGSAGKSLLAQQLCTAMEAGIPTLGLTIARMNPRNCTGAKSISVAR